MALDQSELIAKLVRAIREIDAKATPYGEDDDGFVTLYVMPVGPLHRALGLVAGLSESEGETVLGGVVFRVLLGDRHGDGQWDAVLVQQPPLSAEAGDTCATCGHPQGQHDHPDTLGCVGDRYPGVKLSGASLRCACPTFSAEAGDTDAE